MGKGVCFVFNKLPSKRNNPPIGTPKHYWLCTRCCESYTIEYQKGVGVLLMQRLETMAGGQPCYSVLQAEIAPKPALPRRLVRSRSRQRKQKIELVPVTVSAIEVLENRNLERRG